MPTKRLTQLVVILLGLASLTPAAAVDGLAWQWSESMARTYHIQSQIRLPRFIFFNSFNNVDVRLVEARLELVTTCKGANALGKSAWELECLVDDISIQGVSLPQDGGRLDAVTQEWDERLTGETIQIQFTNDGRIRNVGFQSLARRNRRDGENIERVRQLLTRMYSPLDFRLPKKGSDKGIGAWSHKDALLTGFMSSRGTTGAVQITHEITGTKGDQIKVLTNGTGTVGNIDSAVDVAGQEQIDTYKMQLTTETFFDIAKGEMIRRQAAVSGNPTAGSAIADGAAGITYIQAYALQIIREGEAAPQLPESKEIQSAFAE